MNDLNYMLSGLQPDELNVINAVMDGMNEEQRKQFLFFYVQRRKESQTILLLTLVGFFGFAGLQRFVLGQTGMGIIYFLTVGFCGVGTIVDILDHRKMTFKYNQKQAYECAAIIDFLKK